MYTHTHTYIYVCVCVSVCVCVCCAFVGMDNKLYKMHGTYIKVVIYTLIMDMYIYLHFTGRKRKYHSLCIQ